tara:strand:- start:529 stop:1278 length:750 start_codon:yes stop_codon:yes gene_type:complete
MTNDNLFYIIIAAIIQGLTEFLPISSSGHLVILKDVLNQEIQNFNFEIMLHLGTVFSIIIYYRLDLLKMIKLNSNSRYNIFLIFIGCIPISIIGILFKDLIELHFNDIKLLPYSFLLTAIVLFLTKFSFGSKKMNLKIAFIVGLLQILALFPGISRSGITISTLLLLGVNKDEAIRFSFFMAIPLILGASLISIEISNFSSSIIGILISFIFGWLAIYLSNLLLKNQKYWMFSIYCFIISIILLFINKI